MLSADEAADYCGFKTTRQFLAHVRSRVQAVSFGNYERWDRHRLDEWLDGFTAPTDGSDIVAALFNEEPVRSGSTKAGP